MKSNRPHIDTNHGVVVEPNWQNNRSKAQTDSRDYLQALRRISLPIGPQPEGQAIKTLLTALRHSRIANTAIGLMPGLVNQRFYSACNSHYLYRYAV